jgi:hypothetical protein
VLAQSQKILSIFVVLSVLLTSAVYAADKDNNPPGLRGGVGTNWENPPGPRGGIGASRDRRSDDDNPPGLRGGVGTNWENPPGPKGGAGTSPNRRSWRWWRR